MLAAVTSKATESEHYSSSDDTFIIHLLSDNYTRYYTVSLGKNEVCLLLQTATAITTLYIEIHSNIIVTRHTYILTSYKKNIKTFLNFWLT